MNDIYIYIHIYEGCPINNRKMAIIWTFLLITKPNLQTWSSHIIATSLRSCQFYQCISRVHFWYAPRANWRIHPRIDPLSLDPVRQMSHCSEDKCASAVPHGCISQCRSIVLIVTSWQINKAIRVTGNKMSSSVSHNEKGKDGIATLLIQTGTGASWVICD